MLKPTKATLIIKRELETGLIVKQIDPTGKFIEYWIYQDHTSGTINSGTGHYAEGTANVESAPEKVLKCVVVCENEEAHIVKDMEKHFLVKGYLFSDDKAYPDLTDYLGRTERHL